MPADSADSAYGSNHTTAEFRVKDLPSTPPPSAAAISRESIYDAQG